jgi:hypothetical protein
VRFWIYAEIFILDIGQQSFGPFNDENNTISTIRLLQISRFYFLKCELILNEFYPFIISLF